MKTTKTLLLISTLIFFFACNKAPIYKSNLQSSDFTFNGSDQNWQGQYYYDSDAKLFYGLSNDSDNLFVRLKVTDISTQRKIQVRGLRFWMDSVGKSKEQMTIHCPLPRSEEDIKKMMRENSDRPDKNKKRPKPKIEKFSNGLEGMEIMGFSGNPKTLIVNNKNKNGINVMMTVNDQEELIWEAVIPLELVFTNPKDFQSGGNKYFSFGFETGAFSGSPGGNRQGAGGGRPGGGRPGGGHGGGQRGGGMNQQGMGEMQSMMSPSKVKVKRVNLSFERN